jgi:hypothetical protein
VREQTSSFLPAIVFSIVVAGAIACASSAKPATTTVTQSTPDRLTSVEIQTISASNAYELISRLRPRWLQQANVGSLSGGARNQIIAVYLDGARMGGTESLRSISSNGIKTMQYYDATRAAVVLRDAGSDPIAGAILITTTRE